MLIQGPAFFVKLFRLCLFTFIFHTANLVFAAEIMNGNAPLAFPGAEGFGAHTIGGRGGQVIKVTNLNDSGPGSFRSAVEAPRRHYLNGYYKSESVEDYKARLEANGHRIIVFDVSGIINLESDLIVSYPFITIAGQTSPGGILITGYPTIVKTHDVVIQHLRFRVGNHRIPHGANPETLDAFDIWGKGWSDTDAYNIIVDHCSFSWGVDETFTISGGAYNTTVQWSIISEGLAHAGHPKGEHSKGLMVHGKGRGEYPETTVSLHHNYIAHSAHRTPLVYSPVGSEVTADVVNNVSYNWRGSLSPQSGGTAKTNWVHNYMKPGNNTNAHAFEVIYTDPITPPVPLIYVEGNIGSTRLSQADPQWNVGVSWTSALLTEDYRQYTPWPAPQVTTTPMSYEYAQEILTTVGATAPFRDSVDQRVISDFVAGTGSILGKVNFPDDYPTFQNIAAPTDEDSDGMADSWEIAQGLDPFINDSALDTDEDGYTNIEEYLHFLAAGNKVSDSAPTYNTYHVSPEGNDINGNGTNHAPWLTIGHAITQMSGGDTLVVQDGIYTGAENAISGIPSGVAGRYTKIVAATPFGARIKNTSPLTHEQNLLKLLGNHIKVDGFIFEINDSVNPAYIGVNSGNYNKITRSIFKRTGATEADGGLLHLTGDYNLVEDVAGVGACRYCFSQGGSTESTTNNIWRRVIARFDYTTSTLPKATFSTVGNDATTAVRDHLYQNVITVDGNPLHTTEQLKYGGFYFPNNASNIAVNGSIVLNEGVHHSGIFLNEWGDGNHAENIVVWDLSDTGIAVGIQGDRATAQNITLGGITSGDLYNLLSHPTNVLAGQTPANLLSNDNGANIMMRYGISGTLWGEPGYNQLTTEKLWPWPYEAEIKAVFSEINAPAVNSIPLSNDPTRGFCANKKQLDGVTDVTLTSYIWEYLGTPIPCEVYNTCDFTPPTTSSLFPAEGETNIAIDETITVQISDEGAGIDTDSILMTVAGVAVNPIITGDPSNYTLTYTPLAEVFPYYTIIDVSIDASDLDGNRMPQVNYTFTTEGVPGNNPPVLDHIADISLNEGAPVMFQPTATDPDGDNITFAYSGWITENNYTTIVGDAGVHTVTVTAHDDRGGSDSQDVTVTVHAPGSENALPAFPGAEGFGAYTIGGRGGKIVKVTNLNDSGPGSLRAAVEAPPRNYANGVYEAETLEDYIARVDAEGHRIVIFEVSGIINLESTLTISYPFITIAGQTSPGGILVTGYTTIVKTHDVIMQHMRFRVGSHRIVDGADASTLDAFDIWGRGWGKLDAYNIIVDHCSFSWGVDETFTISGGAYNTTVQWSIISEGLNDAGHPDGKHSKGLMVHGKGQGVYPDTTVSLHHNYVAHHAHRIPLVFSPVGIEVTADVVNNVSYNWQGGLSPQSGGTAKTNWVHNYMKQGVDSYPYSYEVSYGNLVTPPVPLIYVEGNIGSTRLSQSDPEWNVGYKWSSNLLTEEYRKQTPWPATPVSATPMSYDYAWEILTTAGATAPVRDSVDERVLKDFAAGTGRIIDNIVFPDDFPVFQYLPAPADADNDGMADEWEAAQGFDIFSNDSAQDADGDGYTNIEEYLHHLSAVSPPLELPNSAPILEPIDDVTVTEGQTVILEPRAADLNGDSLSFTYSGWMSSNSYTTVAGDAGNHIVTVTVSDGILTDSQDVNIIVIADNTASAPSISTHPVDLTVAALSSAEFSVVAEGTPPLNYQWQKNGFDLQGETGSTLTFASVTVGDKGSYQVLVSNAYGQTTSTPATLTVESAPPPEDISALPFWVNSDTPRKTAEISVTIPSGATHADIVIQNWDGDYPAEGRLYVNDSYAGILFGGSLSENRRNGTLTLRTEVSLWQEGINRLTFVYVQDDGFHINNVAIEFGGTGTPEDTTPPDVVDSLYLIPLSTTELQLRWNPTTDDTGVVYYTVYREGVLLERVSTLLYTDNGLAPGTTHQYQVTATDAAGNESPLSQTVMGTTLDDTPKALTPLPFWVTANSPEMTTELTLSVPNGASIANIIIQNWDGDYPAEGRLYVNNRLAGILFGESLSVNRRNGSIILLTDISLWQEGANQITFVYVEADGFNVNNVTVEFD